MGQTDSAMRQEGPPETLDECSLDGIASFIRSGRAERIIVLTGAGISTAAGIPDFRSPKTGLYNNLARLNLPHAESVFEISFFRTNPEPFYVLAKELFPGKFHPTISHAFVALLASKGLLDMLFTQNIDCLERAAGVPPEKIVEAHGSFATQRCIDCKTEFPDDRMKVHVETAKVPRCVDAECNGLVKPDIVFFGEGLPSIFDENVSRLEKADLVLVIGTSLSVYPFATLPEIVNQGTPRVLLNMERVGRMGWRRDDVLELGPCDAGIRKLAEKLGWAEELDRTWRDKVGDEEADRQLRSVSDMQTEIEEFDEEIIQEMTSKVDGMHLKDEDVQTDPDTSTSKTETALPREDRSPEDSSEIQPKENNQQVDNEPPAPRPEVAQKEDREAAPPLSSKEEEPETTKPRPPDDSQAGGNSDSHKL